MKITELLAIHRISLKRALQSAKSFSAPIRHLLAVAVAVLFCAASASAANLIWDTVGNNGGGGTGNWDTTSGNTNWWNGTTDVAWTQSSTTQGLNTANFNGPGGIVTLDAVQIAPTNGNGLALNINSSGYTFTGANPIYIGSTNALTVAANQSVTFNCNMGGSGTSPYWILGNGATMNVGGSLSAGQQVRLAGGAGSAFNLTGTANIPGIVFVLAPVNMTSGSLVPNSSFYIGYAQTILGTAYSSGSLTISGSSTVATFNGNIYIIARSGGTGTLTVQNGTVTIGSTTATRSLAIDYDGSANSSGTVNVSGGSLTVGGPGTSPNVAANAIDFFYTGASAASASGTLTLSGGTITTYGGIEFGLGGGTGTATLTQTGGTLNVGAGTPGGITKGGSYTGPFSITLSGGTVGNVNGSWGSVLPMTLGTVNGNITFNCANNITLSGPLTDGGAGGGLYKTGSATLTLSGANNYIGSTGVSNGTLAIVTGATPTVSGPVTLDGSAGSPTVSVQVTEPGQDWAIGTLTYQNAGSLTSDFNFGALAPSTSVAPIQVTGNVTFTSTPTVTVEGSSIAVGTYPLITCTGSISGTPPGSVTLTGSASVGSIQTVGKTISLVVTSSTYNPALTWAVGNGTWDTITENWKQNSVPAYYSDGNAVLFDDTASGSSPITVTLNTPVNPLQETFNNTAKSYTISGNGSINGSGALSVLGGGTVTLATANTYSGGTTISAGQLNINNGGTSSATAIGTGTLTIKNGTLIDDTSGLDVALQASIPETWNGNFTYAGSANNFNTGTGGVTMNQSLSLAVNGENFTVGGAISDDGQNYGLSKTGNGTLTLAAGNNFGGGLTLYAGQVNLGTAGSAGTGTMTINGGTIDNISGGPLALSLPAYSVNGGFTFLGSASLNLGVGTITTPSGGSLTVDVVANTLENDGNIVSGNTRVIKSGLGTWIMGGETTSANNFQFEASAGTVLMAKLSGQTIGSGSIGLTVDTGALVIDENSFEIHSDGVTPVPVNLAGGTYDLNGWSENIDNLSISSGGTLRYTNDSYNPGPGPCVVNLISGHTASLSGTNCQFDVITAGTTMTFMGPIGGTGALVTTGAGTLQLVSNNIYTGGTVVSNGTLDVASPNGSIAGNVVVLANGGNVGTLELDTATTLASTATLSVASGATAYLNYSGTQTIGALFVAGIQQIAGVYGNSANNPSGVFTGSGTLTVSGGPPVTISPPTISNNQLTICWNSVAGANYNVYTTTSLNEPQTWTLVNSSPIPATGTITCYTLPGTVSGQPKLFVTVMQ